MASAGNERRDPELETQKKQVQGNTDTGQGIDHTELAAALALLLQPMLKHTVAEAMQAGLDQLRADMQSQNTRITEAEQRIAQNEDDLLMQQTQVTHMESNMQAILD